MKRALLVALIGVSGCDDEGGEDSSPGTTGAAGSTSMLSSSAGTSSSTDASTTAAGTETTDAIGSSSGSGVGSTDGSSSSGGSGSGGSSDSTGAAGVVSFAEIQVDLENVDGAQGAFPSCIDGVPCHNNPDRNVVLVADPTPEQLMQNYQNILNAPGTPWVTPLDDSAQMLNEVSIPDDVRARWLAWIQAGAPFE